MSPTLALPNFPQPRQGHDYSQLPAFLSVLAGPEEGCRAGHRDKVRGVDADRSAWWSKRCRVPKPTPSSTTDHGTAPLSRQFARVPRPSCCCIERRIMWEPNGTKYIVTRKMLPPVSSVCRLVWYSLSHIKEVCRRNPSPRRKEVLHFLWPQCCVVWVLVEFWKAGWKQPGLCFCPLPKDTSRETVGRCRVQLGSCPRRWRSRGCDLLAYKSESTMELNDRIIPCSLFPSDDEMEDPWILSSSD